MTILDTGIDLLERRGYDGKIVTVIYEAVLIACLVKRILEEYRENAKAEEGRFTIITFHAKGTAQ